MELNIEWMTIEKLIESIGNQYTGSLLGIDFEEMVEIDYLIGKFA